VSFLAPVWLALAGAAAVPIILHLLRRRRGTQIEFPAVRFLLRAQREHRRELRVRNLVLMFLRVAVVLAVALAAARPLGRTGGPGHAATAIALVLDNSMSSGAIRGGGTALETLQASAARVLDAASPGDRVWLLTVDGQIASGQAASVRDVLARVQPIGGAGDLVGAVERGAALVHGSGLSSATVVVFTDAQASEWPRPARVRDVPVTVVALNASAPRNRAVRDAQPEPSRWVPRGTLSVTIASADSADVRVGLGDRTLARTTVGPNGAMTVRGVADHKGWEAGRVELPPDELRGDDVRYFAVFAGDAPAVRVDQTAGAFARGAVETLADAGRLEMGGTISVTGADAVTRRPVLAFAPADPVRLGATNRALAAAGIPWRFGELAHDESRVRGGELDGVVVHSRYPLSAAGASVSDTLAMAGGSAWVVAGDGYVLVGSPLDPGASTLPVSAQLLPWTETVVARYLLTDGGRVQSVAPLASVPLPLGVDELVGSDRQTITVRSRETRAPARSGVYWMRRAGAVVGALVVNPEPTESDLTPLDSAGLAQHTGSATAQVFAPSAAVARAAFSTASRRPLAGILLIALVALLVMEALLARDSGARRAAA
jgi:hypothetical protein